MAHFLAHYVCSTCDLTICFMGSNHSLYLSECCVCGNCFRGRQSFIVDPVALLEKPGVRMFCERCHTKSAGTIKKSYICKKCGKAFTLAVSSSPVHMDDKKCKYCPGTDIFISNPLELLAEGHYHDYCPDCGEKERPKIHPDVVVRIKLGVPTQRK